MDGNPEDLPNENEQKNKKDEQNLESTASKQEKINIEDTKNFQEETIISSAPSEETVVSSIRGEEDTMISSAVLNTKDISDEQYPPSNIVVEPDSSEDLDDTVEMEETVVDCDAANNEKDNINSNENKEKIGDFIDAGDVTVVNQEIEETPDTSNFETQKLETVDESNEISIPQNETSQTPAVINESIHETETKKVSPKLQNKDEQEMDKGSVNISDIDNLKSTNQEKQVDSVLASNSEENKIEKVDPENNEEQETDTKELSPGLAVKILQKIGKIENATISFLNLDGLTFEVPVILKNCNLQGFVARGTKFEKGLVIEKCELDERLELSAWRKEDEFVHTVIDESMIVTNCVFKSNVSMRNAYVNGNLIFESCEFIEPIRLDRCNISGNIVFEGEGKISLLSAFLAKCSGEFKIFNHHFVEEKDKGKGQSLDLNAATFGCVRLIKCRFDGQFDMKRARLGSDLENDALCIQECVFQGIDICETIVKGRTFCNESEIRGLFKSEMPLEKSSKAGKPTLFQNDVVFDSVVFCGKSSFYSSRFINYAKFTKCIFRKEVNFNQCEFAQVSSFWTSEFCKSGNFRKAHFVGRSNFGKVKFGKKSSFNEAVFESEANFYLAEMEGDIFFSKAIFNNNFVLRNIICHGGLGLSQIHVEKDLKISQSNVKDRFILSNSTIEGNFVAPALVIGTWGTLAECRIKGYVDLGGLKVGKNLTREDRKKLDEIREKKLLKDQNENKEEIVPGTLYLAKSTFHREINLFAMSIAGNLDMDGINSYSEIEMNSLEVGNNLMLSNGYFRGLFRCENIKVKVLISEYTRFKEELSWNGIKCANISLRHSSFDGGFTMRYGKVHDVLCLSNTDVDGKVDLFRCNFDKIYFNHMIVDHFLIERKILGDKLTSEQEEKYTNAAIEYGILKQSFQARNDYESMDWAYYRFCRCKRKNKKWNWKSPFKTLGIFLNWLFLDLGFGYGTRPMNIAGVALSIVFLFAGIFYWIPQGILGSNGVPLIAISLGDAFYMSITTFASMDYGNSGPDLNHWLKHLFSLEGTLGIFLTTLFVATISRKIIRT